jgi:phosphopantothenoylcysteine synthetase/decarboxylase
MNKEMTTATLDSKRIAPRPRQRPKILLAITGSVAAIKGPELAVRLVKGVDAHVRILLTKGGENFWNKAEAYNQIHWTTLHDLMKPGSEDEDRGKISIICKFFW